MMGKELSEMMLEELWVFTGVQVLKTDQRKVWK